MTCIDDAMWIILDIFDDIYFDLNLILLAIEIDKIDKLLKTPLFDPLQTVGKY